MRIQVPRVIVTGKPEPHAWSRGERSGVIYRVEVSDGSGNVRMNCASQAVYESMTPFQAFAVDLTIEQNQNNNYLTIMAATPVK